MSADEIKAVLREVLHEEPVRRRRRRELLSLTQAAAMLGVSRNKTLHKMLASGELRSVVVCGKTRIPIDEIERIKAGRPVTPTQSSRPQANDAAVSLEAWRPPDRLPLRKFQR